MKGPKCEILQYHNAQIIIAASEDTMDDICMNKMTILKLKIYQALYTILTKIDEGFVAYKRSQATLASEVAIH